MSIKVITFKKRKFSHYPMARNNFLKNLLFTYGIEIPVTEAKKWLSSNFNSSLLKEFSPLYYAFYHETENNICLKQDRFIENGIYLVGNAIGFPSLEVTLASTIIHSPIEPIYEINLSLREQGDTIRENECKCGQYFIVPNTIGSITLEQDINIFSKTEDAQTYLENIKHYITSSIISEKQLSEK